LERLTKEQQKTIDETERKFKQLQIKQEKVKKKISFVVYSFLIDVDG
jgi:hypothetical protein